MPRRARRSRKREQGRLGLWTAVALLLLAAGYMGALELSRPHVSGDRLRFDTFVDLVERGQIQNVHVLDEDAYAIGLYVRGATTEDRRSDQPTPGVGAVEGESRPYNVPLVRGSQTPLLELLIRNRVPTTVDQQVGKRVVSLATALLPGLILVVLFAYLILSYRRGTGVFGVRSGARKMKPEETTVTFHDVAGQESAVAELREVRDYLADPERFTAVGAPIPKGILLYGPPGCGKTLLARALAGEAGASFYSVSGADFVEMYVGVGAARVRDLFEQARDNAPAIIFIDELDSIGRARGLVGVVQSHGEQEQALNQILAEMDGFSPSDGIMVLGATNRPDVLDPALLRPGRFDRTVGLERPDERGRLAILTLHAQSKRLAPGVDLGAVADRAIGLTGADLASVMNEGALLAVRAGRAAISQVDLDQALRRILEAPERQRRLSLRERSIGKRFTAGERVSFADVAGVDDAIEELAEIREYLADPERFARLGAHVPRGILLVGPPGCGKTLLARAVAGETNAAFFSVTASEFVERFVGLGASRVRELFAEARAVAPAIVFIDEIDSIGAHRGAAAVDGHREREQTLNQILVELDGFEPRTAMVVMAATNRAELLDSALVRPGRFDRRVTMTLPDRAGRRAILALHARGKPLGADVDLGVVAGLTPGFSGADLANVLNEATLLAARRGGERVPMAAVEEAIDRATLGIGSRATLMSPEERRVVAYHEAGHALVAMALPNATPPHKLTIVSRGAALGHCATLDTHDRVLRSRSMLMNEMAVLLAGQVAEELVFGESWSGTADDLHRVGKLARHMVRELGVSEALGRLGYPDGQAPDGGGAYSEATAGTIDAEARRLAEEAGARAQAVLTAGRTVLDRVAVALLERETLSAEDLARLVGPIRARPRTEKPPSPQARAAAP